MRIRETPTEKRHKRGDKLGVIGTSIKRVLKVSVALVASVAMLGSSVVFADETSEKVADGDTRNTYNESFGATNSTRYAGRVWTDKSVSADNQVIFSGGDSPAITVGAGDGVDKSDFLVTYSAMATSEIVTEPTPTDTVFILDLSASMTWGYSEPQEADGVENSRLDAMIKAVNSAIDELVRSNAQNRIAIVAFSGNLPSEQLMPKLTTGDEILKEVTDGEYLSLTDWDQGTDGDDDGDNNHRKDHDDASAFVKCNYTGHSVKTAGGTNIQAGLFAGMSILANNEDTTYTVNGTSVTRIPNVVLMSDGAPTTFSSAYDALYEKYQSKNNEETMKVCMTPYIHAEGGKGIVGTIGKKSGTDVCRNPEIPVYSGSWWQTNSGQQIGAGDNDNPDSADGVMALLTAAYFKDRITERYYCSDAGDKQANVYTVGFATNVQNNEMAMMANIVLNPAEYLDQARNFAAANNDKEGTTTETLEINNKQIQQVPSAIDDYLEQDDAVMQGSIGDGGNQDQIMFMVPQGEDGHPSPDISSVNYPTKAFTADDGDSLNAALSQIVGLITEHAKAPTQVESDPAHSGYITYVDPIGEYMHVDSIKRLIWAGKEFVVDEDRTDNSNSGVTTYKFKAKDSDEDNSIDSPVYGQHSVDDIIVTVTKSDSSASDNVPERQELKVQIPANSIPLRVNTVTLDEHGEPESNISNNALPLRLVYGVSLNDDVKDGTHVNSKIVSSTYMETHTENGNVFFYTNLYSGQLDPDDSNETMGDATVTFTPAKDNPFYYVQEDTPLYTCSVDDGGNVTPTPATGNFDETQQYCFQITYYEGGSYYSEGQKHDDPKKTTAWISRSGSSLKGFVDNYPDTQQLYLKEGSPRLGNLQDISKDKDTEANATDTATRRLRPTWKSDSNEFVVHLGNNGRIKVASPVQPGEASVTVRKTFLGRPWGDNDVFTFTLTPTGKNAGSAPLPEAGDGVSVDEGKRTATVTVGRPLDGSINTNSVAVDFEFPADTLPEGSPSVVYTYEVSEVSGSLPGVSYDTHVATVTVTVSGDSNGDNALDTAVSVSNAGAPSETDKKCTDAAAFTNTFVSVSSLPLTGGVLTPRNYAVVGVVVLLLAGSVWLLARRRLV